MSPRPASIHRHAILKHHYRRAVLATPDFHNLNGAAQWAALRDQVVTNAAPGPSDLLTILDGREPRREEVLAALEERRQSARR